MVVFSMAARKLDLQNRAKKAMHSDSGSTLTLGVPNGAHSGGDTYEIPEWKGAANSV